MAKVIRTIFDTWTCVGTNALDDRDSESIGHQQSGFPDEPITIHSVTIHDATGGDWEVEIKYELYHDAKTVYEPR
jgi:hypothetical protein